MQYKRRTAVALVSDRGTPMTTESLVPLLSAQQVAEVLGVSRWHVDDLARRGELVSVLVGSRLRRYHPDDIAAFIRRKRDGQ